MANGAPAAFPTPTTACDPGMTLRDYFAIRMLAELVSQSGAWSGDDSQKNRVDQALIAYQYADAMMRARGR